MARDPGSRSTCPITCALDLLGDRWTLVVLRDLLLGGRRCFSEFARDEGIATNILSDRLGRLESAGIVERRRDPSDGRKRRYVPTDKGRSLIPLLLEFAVWGSSHTGGTESSELVARASSDRDALVRELVARSRADG